MLKCFPYKSWEEQRDQILGLEAEAGDFMCSATVSFWNVLDLWKNLLMKSTFLNWIHLYSVPKWNVVETA